MDEFTGEGTPHRRHGRPRTIADIPSLLDYLTEGWSRRAAIQALAQYGDTAVKEIHGLLRDPHTDLHLKRELPRVLSQIDTSSSRAVMVASLYAPDPAVSYRALRGLNKIRDRGNDLSYSEESFLPLLQIWAKEYYGLLNMNMLLQTRLSPASRLLQKAIRERRDWTLEKIFRGLDLFLPHGDAYFSYLGFTSERQELREYAIELIDNRVRGELRQTLLPIFAELHPVEVVRKGREIFRLPSDPDAALSEAFFQPDPWLKCCTIGAVAAERIDSLRSLVAQACNDINPLVRETALWALAHWGNTPGTDRTNTTTGRSS